MIRKSSLFAIVFLAALLKVSGQLTDTLVDVRDGKSYLTTQIGNQIWMAENLAFKSESGCRAYNDKPENAKTYGYLYTLEAAEKSCPPGWHLPGNEEWKTMIAFVSLDYPAGGQLKSSTGWALRASSGDNLWNFSALPGGRMNSNGKFEGIDFDGYWWSSIEGTEKSAWFRRISRDSQDIYEKYTEKDYGFSVRCVKDAEEKAKP